MRDTYVVAGTLLIMMSAGFLSFMFIPLGVCFYLVFGVIALAMGIFLLGYGLALTD